MMIYIFLGGGDVHKVVRCSIFVLVVINYYESFCWNVIVVFMTLMNNLNLGLRSEIKKIIWFLITQDTMKGNEKKLIRSSKLIDKLEDLNFENLLLLKQDLLGVNFPFDMDYIHKCYDSACRDVKKFQDRYVNLLVFVSVFAFCFVVLLYKNDLINFDGINNGKFFISIDSTYKPIILDFCYYIICLSSVTLRIIFDIGGGVPIYEFNSKKRKLFICSVCWPLVLVFIWVFTDINSLNVDFLNASFLFFVLGWGCKTFLLSIVCFLNNLEVYTSKKIKNLIDKILFI